MPEQHRMSTVALTEALVNNQINKMSQNLKVFNLMHFKQHTAYWQQGMMQQPKMSIYLTLYTIKLDGCFWPLDCVLLKQNTRTCPE